MRIRPALTAAALAVALTTAGAGAAHAATDTDTRRGPAPTASSVRGSGPFATTKVVVPKSDTPGFGGADVYLPTDRSQGTFGGVVLMAGLNGKRETLSWLAPQLASQGFVVTLVDSTTILDFPAARAAAFDAALTWLHTTPVVDGVLDRDRLAVWGWSMGGGATLRVSKAHPELKAAVDVFPWDVEQDYSAVSVPSLVLAAQLDLTAPNDLFSRPIYRTLTQHDRGFVEITGIGHLRPLTPEPRLVETTTAWLKRYVDGDDRYEPFVCRTGVDRRQYTEWTMPACG